MSKKTTEIKTKQQSNKKQPKHKTTRWHASQESDELIFAVCDRYFFQMGKSSQQLGGEERQRGAAAAVSEWIQKEKHRPDITREKIYPLFWEACQRGFLLLNAPVENHLSRQLKSHFGLDDYLGEITVVNISSETAALHVASKAADKIIELIDRVWKEKKLQFPNDPEKQSVHLGMGAGYAAMLVAKRLAQKIQFGEDMPMLVLHAISTGGFLPNEPHKSPSTYFTYFDSMMQNVRFVALFSETVVDSEDYEKIKRNPSIRFSFEQKGNIDIVLTSLAAADHEHGLLVQYLSHLVEQKLLKPNLLQTMRDSGWIGDVQFQPYSAIGPIPEVCPVRAVTLFELDEMVKMAREPNGKYIVLVAGPCGECGATKKHALKPLLSNENLRLWTHLVTDARTAREMLAKNG
ncbi:MAG: hypothetical protein ACRCUY_11810 [Thermoguttaceae bacterium]